MKNAANKPVKLTKSFVDNLTLPTSGQTLIWASEPKGFGIRLTPKSRVYVVQARVNGKTRRVTLGTHGVITADQAYKKAIKALAEMIDGIDPSAEKARKKALSVTLRKVADDYIYDRGNKLKASTIKDINRQIDVNFSTWANKPISSITREKTSRKHTEISKRAPGQADLAFRVLRALFNYAMSEYRPDDTPILLENPVNVLSQSKKWNKLKPRETRIPNDQIGNAWNKLKSLREDPAQTTVGKTNADLITFLLLTGARLNEGSALTWDRVNLDEGWFYLPDPKNSNPVILPLSTELIKILAARPRKNKYIFPARSTDGHITDPRGTMKKLAPAINLESISAHDLRRTFTVIAWKKCRLPLVVVKLLTNHKLSEDVTLEHYSDKKDLRFLAPEIETISSWIIEQGKIAAGDNVVSIDQARRA
jgi:integrase